MIHVPGAGFCDDQLPVLSTIGRGPVGPEGPKGDSVEPTFADPIEWDDNRSYAAYTIVLHDGDSYTSKVAVPVGISIEDDDYWVHTGNYNAQLAALEDEVDEIRSSARTVYRGLNVACIGDSWTTGYIDGTNTRPYPDYIRESGLFAHVWSYGTGGGGYITPSANPAFSAQADNLISEHGSLQDVDIILVVGGINDMAENIEATMEAAISSLMTKLKNAFPYATIYVGANCVSNPYPWQLAFLDRIPIIAQKYGAVGMHNLHTNMLGLINFYMADRFHPTVRGYNMFAACVLAAICGQEYPQITYNVDISDQFTIADSTKFSDFHCVLYKQSQHIQLIITVTKASQATISEGEIIGSFSLPYSRLFDTLAGMTHDYRPNGKYGMNSITASLNGIYNLRIDTGNLKIYPGGTTSLAGIKAYFEFDLRRRQVDNTSAYA